MQDLYYSIGPYLQEKGPRVAYKRAHLSLNKWPHVSSYLLSQRQILGTGNLPQDSAPVCINIDISPEMAAQSAQRNQAFCVTASDWSPIPCQPT